MELVHGGRKDGIIALFDFKVGSFPEKYLGIPLIQGRVTKHMILPLLDKIRARASSWAGRLLSFQGRVTLVKSVFCSLPVYNMGVFKWPQSVIKEGEKILRNFIWSRNQNIRKFHTIAWKKVCRPVAESDLGIRRLGEINEAFLMKQSWVLLEGQFELSKFMHAKFFTKFGEIVGYVHGSSMWKGIALALSRVANKCSLLVGDGRDIDIWRDCWGSWPSIKVVNESMDPVLAQAGINSNEVPIVSGDRDKLIWRPDLQGKFSTKSAFNSIRERANTVWWHKFVWMKCIHPRISSFAWRVCWNALATDDILMKKGIVSCFCYCMCMKDAESADHLLWTCSKAHKFWEWFANLFQSSCPDLNLKNMLQKSLSFRSYLGDLWLRGVWGVCLTIWKARNGCIFDNVMWNEQTMKRQILNAIQDTATLSVGSMQNCIFDLQIIAKLGVLSKVRKPSRVRSVYWSLPESGEVKINTDGATLGNQGKGESGAIFRAPDGEVLGAISVELPIVTSFIAECSAIIESLEHCSSMGWEIAWVEGDSVAAIQAFSNDAIPWVLDARWKIKQCGGGITGVKWDDHWKEHSPPFLGLQFSEQAVSQDPNMYAATATAYGAYPTYGNNQQQWHLRLAQQGSPDLTSIGKGLCQMGSACICGRRVLRGIVRVGKTGFGRFLRALSLLSMLGHLWLSVSCETGAIRGVRVEGKCCRGLLITGEDGWLGLCDSWRRSRALENTSIAFAASRVSTLTYLSLLKGKLGDEVVTVAQRF
ncbi:hypothetical protein GIB67_007452 [Kingdonia uniflora]|uniref:Reverse transcriptase zinc-binding domain-containing protein n=1 Tax=Kingdonia uniflora TaxID=39325 RepID=A0A7J7L4W3_9MAGN|nr:hypothetical protein GIB67_007452 [Kingdonia uniflora]